MNGELTELAGLAGLAARARAHADVRRPREALHLLDIALSAEPGNADALAVKKFSLEQLLAAGANTILSKTMWLKSEISAVEAPLQ